MEIYNINNIKNLNIKYPDIYFTPEYGKACEYSDNATWELCLYKDLIYVYLKQKIVYEGKTYYDLITPYGYSGYYFENEETYKEFLPIFRKKAKERGYITEVVRQNPYLDINLTEYDIITSKTIYGIKINDFESYFNKILHAKKRNMYKKALRDGFIFELVKINNGTLKNKFADLYDENMKKVNASQYYYFNDNYFNSIEKMSNTYLALCRDTCKTLIGSIIVFVYDSKVHYHLSCNNNSSNCITDFLLINIIKELCVKKIFILGGGIYEGDTLSKFKSKLSNKKFKYTIYKNILNQEIYTELSKTKTSTNDFFPCYRQI